ncbi:hypothetical protein [Anaerospora hongkongensis]|uniref:hypothetical protein n=1 Tax=Anaerospora hongkongensis TaxID=244830 RepID=UPI0028A11681|nr:hypothetical protein [Anaerospora hongkongensis]
MKPNVNQDVASKLTTNKKKIVLTAVAAVIVIALLGYWYWTKTPQYSLKLMQESVVKHDLAAFNKYVDIDSVTSRAIDQLLELKLNDPRDVQDDTTKNFAAGLIKILKPQLVAVAKEEIKTFVEKGTTELPDSQSPNNPKMKELLNTGSGKAEFKGVAYTNKDGKIATVGLDMFYPKLNSTTVLEVKMREMDGYWQIAEISNLASFVKKLEELETAKLAEINKQTIAEINNAIRLENITITKQSPNRYAKVVTFPSRITFLTPKDIREFQGLITVKTQDGKLLLKDTVTAAGTTTPGKVVDMTWSKEVNMFSQSDNLMFNTPADQLVVSMEFQRLKFSDGTELKILDKLP